VTPVSCSPRNQIIFVSYGSNEKHSTLDSALHVPTAGIFQLCPAHHPVDIPKAQILIPLSL